MTESRRSREGLPGLAPRQHFALMQCFATQSCFISSSQSPLEPAQCSSKPELSRNPRRTYHPTCSDHLYQLIMPAAQVHTGPQAGYTWSCWVWGHGISTHGQSRGTQPARASKHLLNPMSLPRIVWSSRSHRGSRCGEKARGDVKAGSLPDRP